jgi:UDP-N-acetylmuramyl pentapeptide phosphotransferase/UDP-N-acetylglucosamine-1-phosphate transferase
MIIYPAIALIFFASELVYFRIADRYNITDHPTDRGSHTISTIRGGGAVFLVATLCVAIVHPSYWLPVLGVFIIGIVSFLDDIYTLSSRTRLLFHVIAVTVMFYYLGVLGTASWYIFILLYIMVIGVINMYNFMDGINGITGSYSLMVLCGLQYINVKQIAFIGADMIWFPLIACIVFLFFNFRKKAKCFAGDVGSVTMAFWIIMLLVRLIFLTHNWSYILFLVVYGVDSVLTIAHRLVLKQNIVKPHRMHFYQVMANERKLSHLWISAGYALLQGGIIYIIIANPGLSKVALFLGTIIPLSLIYLIFKPRFMRERK